MVNGRKHSNGGRSKRHPRSNTITTSQSASIRNTGDTAIMTTPHHAAAVSKTKNHVSGIKIIKAQPIMVLNRCKRQRELTQKAKLNKRHTTNRKHPKNNQKDNHNNNRKNNAKNSKNNIKHHDRNTTNNKKKKQQQQQQHQTQKPPGVSEKGRISKDAINSLPLIRWQGRICVMNTVDEMKQGVNEIFQTKEQLLGMDTETRPAFRKGESYYPALIQLATSQCVYLFRICKIQHSLEPLYPLLQSQKIIKTGVGIQQDVKELCTMMNDLISSSSSSSSSPPLLKGFVDVTTLTKDVLHYKDTGLRPLAALLMKGRVSKAAQMSNWACPHDLTPKQINYAATDAWVSREIYVCAQKEQQQEQPQK